MRRDVSPLEQDPRRTEEPALGDVRIDRGTGRRRKAEAALGQPPNEILADSPVWGSYFVPGANHTIIGGPGYYSTEISGVPLTQWLADLLAGDPAHVSP